MKILICLESEHYVHPPILMGNIIAHATRSTVDILVVVPEDGHWENGEAVARQAQEDLEEIPVNVFLRRGDAFDIYREVLENKDYQLVIVHAHRRAGLRQHVDVESALLDQSQVSVLLTENIKPKIGRILLATACKENDHSLLRQGANLAQQLAAKITLLHVASGSVPSMYTGLDQFDETVPRMLKTDTPFAKHLRKGVEILNEKVVPSEVKIRHGVPVEEIVREAQLENYDLVIVGASGVKNGIKGRLLGNLTTKIIDQVKLPVLVVGDRSLNTSHQSGSEGSDI